MNTLSKFFLYNNLVPLLVSVVFVGAGAAFASTEGGQQVLGQTLVGKVETVVAVDNTYIASKDLSAYSPQVTVTTVTEDADTFYVAYTLATIDIDNYVWKDVTKQQTLTVTKDELAHYKDLASYVQFQLKDVVNGEKDRLVRTQESQRKAVTQKTVATEYTGLVGAVLTTSTVVEDPYAPTPSTDVPAPESQQARPAPTLVDTSVPQVAAVADAASADTTSAPQAPAPAASVQLLGSATVEIHVNDVYTDLGALAKDASGADLVPTVTVDGAALAKETVVVLDTNTPGAHTIIYSVTDTAGNTVSATRTVTVVAPAAPAVQPAQDTPSTDAAPVITPPTPEQSGAPEQTPAVDTVQTNSSTQ